MASVRPLVRNAGDPQQVRRAGRRENLEREQELYDLRQALASASVRRLLWRIYVKAGGKDTLWAEDPYRMSALAGQREIALWLESEISDADPRAMLVIRTEAQDFDVKRERELEAADRMAEDEPNDVGV